MQTIGIIGLGKSCSTMNTANHDLTPLPFLNVEDSTPPLHVERGGRPFDYWSADGVRLK